MDDYLDRLEAQLASLTARGAHDRRRGPSPRWAPGLAPGHFAVAFALVVVVAVGAVFFAARSTPRSGTNGRAGSGQPTGHGSPSFTRPPKGTVVCRTRLMPPGGGGSPSGTARIYEQAPGHYVLWAVASGLRPTSPNERYAVWLSAGPVGHPAVSVGTGHPTTTANGKLSIVARLPSYASAYHLLMIVRQPTRTARPGGGVPKRPGRTVLDGPIEF